MKEMEHEKAEAEETEKALQRSNEVIPHEEDRPEISRDNPYLHKSKKEIPPRKIIYLED